MSQKINRLTVTFMVLAGFVLFGLNAGAQQTDQQSRRQSNQMDMARSDSSSMGQFNLGAGFQQKDINRNTVDKTVAGLTNAALTKGNFGDFTDSFTDPDSNRLQSEKIATDDLDRSIEQFRTAWQNKYHQDFNAKKQTEAYGGNFMSVVGAEVTDPNQVTNWPAGSSAQKQPGQQDKAIKKGSEVAVLSVSNPSQSQKPLQLSLVHELIGGWKIDIPDNVTATDLKSSLVRHIDEATQSSSQWPADQSQAYQEVSRHILMAIDDAARGRSSGTQGQGHTY